MLRAITFRDGIHDIRRIKVVENPKWHLTVYIDKNHTKDVAFEKKFCYYMASILRGDWDFFSISFSYAYPFRDDGIKTAEMVFIKGIEKRGQYGTDYSK